MSGESIQPFVLGKVLVLPEDAPVKTAARAMRDRRVGTVVVTNHEGHLIGIVTDRDLTTRILAEALLPDTPLSAVMTKDILTIDETAELHDAISAMEEKGIRRVPVVHKTKRGHYEKCAGMIALDDLLAANAIAPAHVSQIVKAQVRRRVRSFPARTTPTDEAQQEELKKFKETMTRRTGLREPLNSSFPMHVLGLIVQRLPFTAATHFIQLLPKLIQEYLSEFPPGPDRTITPDFILNELQFHFGLPKDEVASNVKSVWAGLKELVDNDELQQVLQRLPSDIRKLFGDLKQASMGYEGTFSPAYEWP